MAASAAAAAVVDLSAQHARARRLVATVEYQLQQLEEGAPRALGGNGVGGSDEARHALAENVNSLASEAATLERHVAEQYGVGVAASSQKAQLWRKRLSQLQAEAASLRKTVERFLRTSYATSRVAAERQALLGSGTANAGTASVTVDALLAERTSVAHSASMVDEFTDLAGSVLGSLRQQRGVMKSAHRKVLDVASTLGMSNTLMRMIERRTVGDKILVYGGVLLIAALIVLIWYWVAR